jgi:ubiquinone/menaquinone biosynthesis C-methylase UbiE
MALSQRIASYWDAHAHSYDGLLGHGLKDERERQAWSQLLQAVLPRTRPTRVLDVGTGTGFLALLLADLGCSVVATDISAQMLRVAKSKAAGRSIRFLNADATDILEDESFDTVVSRHLLWTLPDPEAAVRAWRAMTRPGGLVLAIDGTWWGSLSARMLWPVRVRARSHGIHDCHQRSPYRTTTKSLPLMTSRSWLEAADVFIAAGLLHVAGDWLQTIDSLERQQMSLMQRMTHRYRRYIIAGTA